ncbi:PREDICTED: uncharacterized protein LOC109473303 [Branchiostoma belcheri]|uniref:Uncharacterized protein LOC109473303 n=1 Tax=Branchiostoma belcheri TaxID=7741 RepID=A0A6P4YHG0_BRABE|nr:PREDICTED: uncharacterized protein LOC109473303 [Branchiostoma belcheri]
MVRDALGCFVGGPDVPVKHMNEFKLRHVAQMALYLNTVGLEFGNDLINVIKTFYTSARGMDDVITGKTTVGDNAVVNKVSEMGGYQTYASTMTAEQIQEMTKSSRQSHMMNESVKTSVQFTMDEMVSVICELVKLPTINTDIIFNALSYELLEPRYMTDLFYAAVRQVEEVYEDPDQIAILVSQICNRPINILGSNRMATFRTELYDMVMPRRFILVRRDSTPNMDHLLNTLLGASSAIVRSFYEICNFIDFDGLTSSDEVITRIQLLEKTVVRNLKKYPTPLNNFSKNWTMHVEASIRPRLIDEFKCLFGTQQCFLMWLELCRRFVDFFRYTDVGNPFECRVVGDHIVPNEQPHPDATMGDSHPYRVLPTNTIYYDGNFYYGFWERGYKCRSYRGLLARVWYDEYYTTLT